MRRYYFQVTGKGDFPFHLLSIYKAYPVDLHAAHRIALSCPTVAPEQNIWLETTVGYPNSRMWEENKWPITALT